MGRSGGSQPNTQTDTLGFHCRWFGAIEASSPLARCGRQQWQRPAPPGSARPGNARPPTPLRPAGVAHLLEHLAFKGTPRLGSRDWARESAQLRAVDEGTGGASPHPHHAAAQRSSAVPELLHWQGAGRAWRDALEPRSAHPPAQCSTRCGRRGTRGALRPPRRWRRSSTNSRHAGLGAALPLSKGVVNSLETTRAAASPAGSSLDTPGPRSMPTISTHSAAHPAPPRAGRCAAAGGAQRVRAGPDLGRRRRPQRGDVPRLHPLLRLAAGQPPGPVARPRGGAPPGAGLPVGRAL